MISKRTAMLHAGLLILASLMTSQRAHALGECGLACCLAGADGSGISTAKNFGLAVQYEYSDMETIRNGTTPVTPDSVINQHWTMGSMYRVPTRMIMEKLSVVGALPLNERWQLLGIVPIQRNRMDMRMRNAMGMTMNMKMRPITGLGDVSLLARYVAFTDAPLRPKERLTLGFGIKAPTGEYDTRGPSGGLVHAMMQLGSGSWDALFTANYMRAYYPLVTQVNAFYHLTTEGKGGYEFGDQFGMDFVARLQVSKYTNISFEFNMIHAGQDEDHDGAYSSPTTSMVDNPANTGLTSWFITPGVQYKIPNTGGSIDVRYQHPIRQDVRGFQQVVDGRLMATLAWQW